ncbi:MAG: class I SAM-dependent DNA methyltransferase [Thermoguttaceae bacterium]
MLTRILNRIRLNLRAIKLAVSGRWLQSSDYASSYDEIAATYDENWLKHLHSTTDEFHKLLPDTITGEIIELGCGSGYTTQLLRKKYPSSKLIAVDISQQMLELAKNKLSNCNEQENKNSEEICSFVCQDMLEFLKGRRDASASLIVSSWAIGYSNPAEIIAEANRILTPGGKLAVLVNRFDTMPAVFNVFRQIMRDNPGLMQKAVWPMFPKNAQSLSNQLRHNSFNVKHISEGATSVTPPEGSMRMNWLLGTGVLAGFDSVLPIRDSVLLQDEFGDALNKQFSGWEHHYIMFVATNEK